MFLKANGKDGRIYYTLAHNERVDGKIVCNTIQYLGKLSDEQVNAVKAWLDSSPIGKAKVPMISIPSWRDVRITESFNHGSVALAYSVVKRTGLIPILFDGLAGEGNTQDIVKISLLIIVNRLVAPCSKRHILTWMNYTTLPFILGINNAKVHENKLYRTMDVVWKRKDKIERLLWERKTKHEYDGTCKVYKDLTSSFFYGNKSEVGKHGYSREKRPDLLQVNWSLVVTPDGKPITMEMYPGDVPDKNTVNGTCHRLKTLFKIEDCVFLGDRGLMTEDNVQVVNGYEYHYVFAEIEDNVIDVIEEALSKGFKVIDDDMSACKIKRDEENYIVIKSKDKLLRDMASRLKRVEKGEEILLAGLQTVKNGTWVKHDVVLKHLLKKLVKKKVDTFFDLEIPPTPVKEFTWTVKDTNREKTDGILVLRTDLKQSMDEIVEMYKGMWIIERGFRTIKSHLKVKPMNHRLRKRIGAHLFLCVLAYYVSKEIEEKLDEGIDQTDVLIEKFSSISFNRLEIGKHNPVRVNRVTELNLEQKRYLKKLGISKKSFDSMKNVELV